VDKLIIIFQRSRGKSTYRSTHYIFPKHFVRGWGRERMNILGKSLLSTKIGTDTMLKVKVYRALKFVYPVKFYLPPTSLFIILPSTQIHVSGKVLPLKRPIFLYLTQKKWLINCIFYRVFGKKFYLHNFTECSVEFT